jgi:hypothetical protein
MYGLNIRSLEIRILPCGFPERSTFAACRIHTLAVMCNTRLKGDFVRASRRFACSRWTRGSIAQSAWTSQQSGRAIPDFLELQDILPGIRVGANTRACSRNMARGFGFHGQAEAGTPLAPPEGDAVRQGGYQQHCAAHGT